MAHVQIKRLESGAYSFIVDDVDMSMMVLAEPVAVELHGHDRPAEVSVVVAADVLDIDLPDAVVKAIRSTDDATARPEIADRSEKMRSGK